MIEDFVKLIPKRLMDKSGKAFYSGRRAFESQSDLYVIGANPGGNPVGLSEETVRSHTKNVLQTEPENWCAYRDESWAGKPPGTEGIQPSLRHLFDRLDLNPGEVPASNLVFQRSTELSTYEGGHKAYRKASLECWSFHESVINDLDVQVVVCFGLSIRNFVCKKLSASQCDESFASNGRRISVTCTNGDGLTVVSLVHPTPRRGYPWMNREIEDDPTESVVSVVKALS